MLWSGGAVFDGLDRPHFVPIKERNWFIHPDETGLCVRCGLTGQVMSRLQAPSGREISQHKEQFLAVTSDFILVVDRNDTEFETKADGETLSLDHYGLDLPSFEKRTIDVQMAVERAERSELLQVGFERQLCQVTAAFGIMSNEGGSWFALGRGGRVDIVHIPAKEDTAMLGDVES